MSYGRIWIIFFENETQDNFTIMMGYDSANKMSIMYLVKLLMKVENILSIQVMLVKF